MQESDPDAGVEHLIFLSCLAKGCARFGMAGMQELHGNWLKTCQKAHEAHRSLVRHSKSSSCSYQALLLLLLQSSGPAALQPSDAGYA